MRRYLQYPALQAAIDPETRIKPSNVATSETYKLVLGKSSHSTASQLKKDDGSGASTPTEQNESPLALRASRNQTPTI